MKPKFTFLILSILLCSLRLLAAPTTEGTEFWVTFMNNYRNTASETGMQLKLIVSSRQSGNVTVKNPQTGWSQTLYVAADKIAEMVIPNAQAYTYAPEKVENHGLQVISSVPVSLYASNYYEYTYDATVVLPITALGKDYIIQTYENELMSKEFCVVATADNTTLSITPHARTTTGHAKNEAFTVTLKKGQTYQVMSSDNNNDFSGSQIHASAPVAVFAGHQCINVPTGITACDHIVEQSMPVEQWGTKFALTKTKGQNSDHVAITARYDNTQVKMNGVVQTTLNALQTWESRLTANSAFVETSQPAACYMYLEGATANYNMGDPSSVHISPVEQRIQEITFATFQTNVSRSHFVNVVTTQAGAAQMTLDGVNISSKFSALTGNASLRFAQIPVSHGTHTLRTTADGFVGHVYGLGWCESYAYSFGSATINLDGDILVDGEPHNETDDGIQRCYRAPIVFSPQTNTDYTSVKWDFGDGSTSTQPTVTHTYSAPKDYKVTLFVEGEEGKDTTYTILHLVETLRDTVTATLCKGETYHLGTKTFSTSGTYNVNFTSAGGCDSVVTLVLNVLPTYQTETHKTIVTGTSFRWHYKWYNKAGTYRDTLTSSNGCDSITILYLNLKDQTEDMYDTICYSPIYTFKGYDYPLPAIDDYKDQDYIDYTIEYRDMETCTVYRMNLAVIPQESGTNITLNDTILAGATYDFFGQMLVEPGTYTTTAEGACGCSFNYTLNLVVLPMPIHDVSVCLCHEDTIMFLGKPYTKPGQYMDTVWSDAGIESIERLTLTDSRSFATLNISDVRSYSFGGKTLTQSGTYTDILKAANGCDSIVTLHLGIGEKCVASAEENVRICYGEKYQWNGKTYSASGTYTASFSTPAGCDSTATLHLTVLPQQQTDFSATIDDTDDYYKWNGVKYTASGDYIQTLVSSTGCDSVVTLHLTVIKTTEPCSEDTTGGFSVSATDKVKFAPGNLQYQASTNTFRFAEHQYDYVGDVSMGNVYNGGAKCDNTNPVPSYDGWIDLFGWGTSNYNDINPCIISVTPSDYVDGTMDIAGTNYDWGVYNKIGNDPAGKWRTLTRAEWTYLCNTRANASNLIGQATVNGVTGIIILPDDWVAPQGIVFRSGTNLGFTENVYSLTQWTKMEAAGACFLPTAGYRGWKTVFLVQTSGSYWTSTCGGGTIYACGLLFDASKINPLNQCNRANGQSVRLARTLIPPSITETFDTICTGETYTWQDSTYAIAGDYTKTLQNIYDCDSTVTLHLSIIETSNGDTTAYICYADQPFIWHGTTAEDGATIHLTNAAGCDSVVTLHLYVGPEPKTEVTDTTICAGDAIEWHGKPYTVAGTYLDTSRVYVGPTLVCDSIWHELRLTVLSADTDSVSKSICVGQSFEWYGKTLTVAGVYDTTFHYVGTECDSITHVLILEVGDFYKDSVAYTICQGEKYSWRDTDYDTDGVYHITAYGQGEECDSLLTLRLIVNQPTAGDTTAYICYADQPFMWHGATAEDGATIHLTNAAGCDSVVTLHLYVGPEPKTEVTDTIICSGDAIEWLGKPYTVAGTYLDTSRVYVCPTLVCDSIWHELRLTVLSADTDSVSKSICAGQSLEWYGRILTESGVYDTTFHYVGTECDSITHVLILEVGDFYKDSVAYTICQGEKYSWHGTDYDTDGIYHITAYGQGEECDSLLTLRLIVNPVYQVTDPSVTLHVGEAFSWNDVYIASVQLYDTKDYVYEAATKSGCDSTVTVHLTVTEAPIEIDTANVQAEIQIASHCADDPYITCQVHVTKGDVQQVGVTFDNTAHAQGFRDTLVAYTGEDIHIPNSARAGKYELTIGLYYDGILLKTVKQPFTLLYPSSVLEQNWDDFIGVLTHDYNGGYDFVQFQWYENNQPMVGQTHSYIYNVVQQGHYYSALLTETNGLQLMTCELLATHHDELTVYPTILPPRHTIHVRTGQPAQFTLYDATGKWLWTFRSEGGDQQYPAPAVSGMYMLCGQIQGQEKVKTVKLIVR